MKETLKLSSGTFKPFSPGLHIGFFAGPAKKETLRAEILGKCFKFCAFLGREVMAFDAFKGNLRFDFFYVDSYFVL